MEWHEALGIVSGVIQIGSIIPYIWDIVHGSTRPNAVSTGLWTLLSGIALAAQISAGASWSVILVAGVAFNCAVITVLALSGYGYAKYGRIDWFCLLMGLVAIGAWVLTANPVASIVLVVLASVISNIPTIVKTYREPASEYSFSWFLVVIASSLSLLSTTQLNAQNLLYPGEDWLVNIIIFSLSFFGQRRDKRPGTIRQ
jgi:hypothetical protein